MINLGYLLERVGRRFDEAMESQLALIHFPMTRYQHMDIGVVAGMRSGAAAAIRTCIERVPPPSFTEFVNLGNSLTNTLHSLGVEDCTLWVEYLREVGADLLYMELASAVDTASEANEAENILKSLKAEVEAEQTQIFKLESRKAIKATTRLSHEALLHGMATSLELARKAVADLERRYEDVLGTVEFIKAEEQTIDATLAEHQSRLVEAEQRARELQDQLNDRDAAATWLADECARRREHMKTVRNPMF